MLFLKNLLLVFLGVLAIIAGLDLAGLLGELRWFTYAAFVFLASVTLLAHFMNIRALEPHNEGRYMAWFTGGFALHFFLAIGFVMAYVLLFQPESKLFILPFFLLFLAFKTVEIYFLLKVSKVMKQKKREAQQ